MGTAGDLRARSNAPTISIFLAVYLLYLNQHRSEISGWTFEEKLRREHRQKRERLPDAIFELRGYRKVVEFGGAYPKSKPRWSLQIRP